MTENLFSLFPHPIPTMIVKIIEFSHVPFVSFSFIFPSSSFYKLYFSPFILTYFCSIFHSKPEVSDRPLAEVPANLVGLYPRPVMHGQCIRDAEIRTPYFKG